MPAARCGISVTTRTQKHQTNCKGDLQNEQKDVKKNNADHDRNCVGGDAYAMHGCR
jgi:hypothetical protein